MIIILHNPLSGNGKSLKIIKKIKKDFKTKIIDVKNILEISDVVSFIKSYPSKDEFIVLGGDGTISKFANDIYGFKITHKIYVYKAGSGNDFYRSLHEKEKLIQINKYLKKLPTIVIDEKKVDLKYLNGVGIGLDANVCVNVNGHKGKKNKLNYFKQTLKAFRSTKKQTIEAEVDGKHYIYKDCWFAAVMNSPYEGGGMKLAPNATRLNPQLYLVVIKEIKKGFLPFILPLVYFGAHTRFKKYVSIVEGINFKVWTEEKNNIQIDGEAYKNCREFLVKSF